MSAYLFILVSSILAIALPLLVIAFFAIKLALHARRLKRNVETKTLIGMTGRAESAIADQGLVFVRGELWHACAAIPITPGASVRVIGFSHLALVVEAL